MRSPFSHARHSRRPLTESEEEEGDAEEAAEAEAEEEEELLSYEDFIAAKKTPGTLPKLPQARKAGEGVAIKIHDRHAQVDLEVRGDQSSVSSSAATALRHTTETGISTYSLSFTLAYDISWHSLGVAARGLVKLQGGGELRAGADRHRHGLVASDARQRRGRTGGALVPRRMRCEGG